MGPPETLSHSTLHLQELCDSLKRKPSTEELMVAADLPNVDEMIRRLDIGKMAKERMVRANMRLVVACAKRYQNQGLHTLDLWQEGNLGLIKVNYLGSKSWVLNCLGF